MTTTIGSLDLNAFSDLYSDSTQYFWFESNSSATYGAGVHVTLVPDTTFISNPTGQNILMNTDGFSIRNGLLPMMVLDNDSLDFNAINTTQGTYTTTTMATFGLTGATIGLSSAAHSVIDGDGQRFYASDGTTELANIGYASGTAAGTTPETAPYYTFGTRIGDIGNYSFAQGWNATASGYCSHASGRFVEATGPGSYAEGDHTYATKSATHAEGCYTYATDRYAHSEGYDTKASGESSHSEGYRTTASGTASHAGGLGTKAQRAYQTAIGEYNIADTGGSNGMTKGDYVFIIGNGTDDTTAGRSNALTVDWNGNVVASGTIKASNSTPSISITKSTGTMVSSTICRFGNVVQLLMTVKNSSSIAQGGNIYEGTITTTALRPIMTTTGGSYYSTSAITGTISTAGDIVIRNEGGAKSFTSNCNISFTYIVA